MTDYLEYTVPAGLIELFTAQARQKIEVEKWGRDGRNTEVKVANFVHCWVTEEAFKQILISRGIWFRYRGLYFGDAQGAGADFTVRIDGVEVSVGLRSVAPESLERWRSVAYPDDRFRDEQDKIAQHHIVCNHTNGWTRLFGAISKEDLLMELERSQRKFSKNNQEYFRVIPMERFRFENLILLLEKMERG